MRRPQDRDAEAAGGGGAVREEPDSRRHGRLELPIHPSVHAGPSELPAEAFEPIEAPQERVSRRRFMSLMAATAALAATSGCEASPTGEVVPYTKKPQDVIPGVADYYASTYQEGLIAYGVLVKAREGRPIHIEGNDEHPGFSGKTTLRAQAETIGLYSPERLRGPRVGGDAASWQAADARVVGALKGAASRGAPVLLVTGAVISPTRRAVIAELGEALPGLRHVSWEPGEALTERGAAEALYGDGRAARYRVDRARVVVCLEADVLGTQGNAVEAVAGYARNRKPSDAGEALSRVYALESRLSVTGSKADERVPLRPSGAAPVGFALARALHERHGLALPAGLEAGALASFDVAEVARRYGVDAGVLSTLVGDLASAGEHSLVVAGASLPEEAHAAAALLNTMLGAEGRTVDTSLSPDVVALATASEMAELTRDLASGRYAAAVFWETNPSYAVSDAAGFNAALAKVPLKVWLGVSEDETSRRCDVVLAVNHWLESWNDYEYSRALLSVQQPLIRPLYETRQAEEVVLGWVRALGGSAGGGGGRDSRTDYRTYLMDRWRREVYPAGTPATFDEYWVAAVHDGVLRLEADRGPARHLRASAVAAAAKAAAKAGAAALSRQGSGDLELLLEPDLRMWDGRYAANGWLQELPDPIAKTSWGNHLAVSEADAKRVGVRDGDVVSVTLGGRSVALPVLVQPGQAEGAVFTVLGYGRAGAVSGERGANVFPLVADDGTAPFYRPGVRLRRTGVSEALVRSQVDFSLHGRDIVRLWSLEEYANNAQRAQHAKPGEHGANEHELATLNGALEWPDHKWGMAIDLSACIGCGACQIACQSENNIPVVGPEQVARGRIMHWIRSDVYYVGPSENPQVAHALMLCQQCDDAPCEPVCPVGATVHSDDGLNEQVYNRCIGVRYCSANCPYEVRRFNFFDYTSFITDPLDLAFNPEVTVRPRGVMEKCTFCVQRIRNGEQVAKDAGHAVRDGEIRTACEVSCPADAIVFGDLKDPNSRVSRLSRSNRGYKVLEEEGTRPAITYLAELRDPVKRPRKNNDA